MINIFDIIKIVAPIAGSLLLDENISPIKQENPYRSMLKNTIDSVVQLANEKTNPVIEQKEYKNIPIVYHPTVDVNMTSPFEIAMNKEYKYTFK